jgi:hypothetical protein
MAPPPPACSLTGDRVPHGKHAHSRQRVAPFELVVLQVDLNLRSRKRRGSSCMVDA